MPACRAGKLRPLSRRRSPTALTRRGLSLGEYTALVFAGVLTFRDGLRVVKRRGDAMQAAADATPGGMLSLLMLELPQVEKLCNEARGSGTLQVANNLCPGNIVVSGSASSIAAIEKLAEAGGTKAIRLAVAGAFHTPLMRPADEALAEALRGVTLQPGRLPVWSNVDGKPHTDPEEIRGLLIRQVLQPVLWETTLRGLLAAGCEKFVEIGPGRVLAGCCSARAARQSAATCSPESTRPLLIETASDAPSLAVFAHSLTRRRGSDRPR